MQGALIFFAAAAAEISGCYAFWRVIRTGLSPLWIIAGIVSLICFAWLLTLVESPASGRVFAAYGGIYIVSSLIWLWRIDGVMPDRYDMAGGFLCLIGAGIILLGPR